MTRLWFRQKGERSYHALLRMADTKYMCGKVAKKLTIVEQERQALGGQLCKRCFLHAMVARLREIEGGRKRARKKAQ